MSKLLAKRKAKDATAVDRRILILDPEKCKPNSAAYAFLKQYAGKCGKMQVLILRGESRLK